MFDFQKILSETGMSLDQILTFAGKAQTLLPKVKEYLQHVKKYEEGLNLKPNQKVLYSLMPVFSPTEQDPNEVEIMAYVFVIEEKETGETVIIDQIVGTPVFSQIEQVLSLIPKI